MLVLVKENLLLFEQHRKGFRALKLPFIILLDLITYETTECFILPPNSYNFHELFWVSETPASQFEVDDNISSNAMLFLAGLFLLH